MAFRSYSSFLQRAMMVRRSCQRQICVPNVQSIGVLGALRFLTASASVVDNTTKLTEHKSLPKDFIYDGLEGLPFDIKDGGREEGYLTLIRKFQNEIIQVKVRPYYPLFRKATSSDEDYKYDSDDDFDHATINRNYETSEGDDHFETSGDDEEVEFDGDRVETPRDKVETPCFRYPTFANGVEGTLQLLEDKEKGINVDTWKTKERDAPYLYMVVKISYGHEYKKWQKFLVIAFPDNKIIIRSMSMGVEGGGHLDECEEYFNQRITEPSFLNFVFSFFPRRRT